MFKVGDLVEVLVGHLVHTDGRTSRVSAAIVKRLTKWH